ncbi:hypothetical protein C8Q74DRAFT_1281756 [Fomes fomentarius]|nr:hypothetical protein C8Q74DRAFT_1281756 [Fomes fomentarius]
MSTAAALRQLHTLNVNAPVVGLVFAEGIASATRRGALYPHRDIRTSHFIFQRDSSFFHCSSWPRTFPPSSET